MGTDTSHRMSDRTKLPGNASAERPAGRLRDFVVRGTELLLAIVLVFVFFLTFLAIIGFSFPQGTSLRDLMVQPSWVERPRPTDFVRSQPSGASRTQPPASRRSRRPERRSGRFHRR